jgi:hypothetical protein
MSGSQIQKADVLFSIYQNPATVFRLMDVALITGITNRQLLSASLNYYVRSGKLQNPRKGIYTKANYSSEELACKLFAPSYISREYVLQKAGVIFQYDAAITSVSYLSRSIERGEETGRRREAVTEGRGDGETKRRRDGETLRERGTERRG